MNIFLDCSIGLSISNQKYSVLIILLYILSFVKIKKILSPSEFCISFLIHFQWISSFFKKSLWNFNWLHHHSEKAMTTHSSTLAWKMPWTEEPGRLQSMGSLRVGHDWATSLPLFTLMHWRKKWQPTPVFLPGESQGQGSLVGCRLWGHTESDMMKRLRSSNSSSINWCVGKTVTLILNLSIQEQKSFF